jgi:hypothetical protein
VLAAKATVVAGAVFAATLPAAAAAFGLGRPMPDTDGCEVSDPFPALAPPTTSSSPMPTDG